MPSPSTSPDFDRWISRFAARSGRWQFPAIIPRRFRDTDFGPSDSDDFDIDAIARWRMGAAYDNPVLDWRSDSALFDHPAAYWQYLTGCFVVTPEGVTMHPPPNDRYHDPWKHKQLVGFHGEFEVRRAELVEELTKVAPGGFGVVVTPQDAVAFMCHTSRSGRFKGVTAQVCPSRPVRPLHDGTTILLSRDFVYRSYTGPFQSPIPWESREAGIFWRGQLAGHSYDLDGDGELILHAMRQPRPFLSSFVQGDEKGTSEDFDRRAMTYQRLNATIRCRGHSRIDIRLTDPTDDRGLKLARYLNARLGFEACVPRIRRDAYEGRLARHKLRLAIPGNDIPSSIRSDLLSDSAVLMPKPYFEGYEFFRLEPGRHYVEVAHDLSDLPERLEWCAANDDLVRVIALEGQRYAARLLLPGNEREVQRRILLRLAENVQR